MQLYFSFTLPHVVLLHSVTSLQYKGLWLGGECHLVFIIIILYFTLPLPWASCALTGRVTYSLLFTFDLTVHYDLQPLLYIIVKSFCLLKLTNLQMVIPTFYHSLLHWFILVPTSFILLLVSCPLPSTMYHFLAHPVCLGPIMHRCYKHYLYCTVSLISLFYHSKIDFWGDKVYHTEFCTGIQQFILMYSTLDY